MGVFKEKTAESDAKQSKTESFAKEAPVKPIIATARTALAGIDSALMRRLPSGYSERTVKDVLTYIVDSEVKEGEADTSKSLRNELGAAGSVIVINGRNAKLTDKVANYLVEKSKPVAGKEVQYQQLEIEVSAVQQGGYSF